MGRGGWREREREWERDGEPEEKGDETEAIEAKRELDVEEWTDAHTRAHYLMKLSFKFHKDLSFGCRDICKTKLTLV